MFEGCTIIIKVGYDYMASGLLALRCLKVFAGRIADVVCC